VTRLPAAAAAALTLLFLAGCIGPMTTKEAQQIASSRLSKYCGGHCGP